MKPVSKPFGHEFELVFEVEVDGVTTRDIFGALYGETEIIESCSLSKLQKEGKAGKCLLETNGERHVLTVPVSASPSETALLAAAIESIECVAGRPAFFKLVKINDRISKRVQIGKRAKELMELVEKTVYNSSATDGTSKTLFQE
ncbi:MAG: hypothetical protein QXG41_07120 [Candidatus Caldarchaeum sp.]